MSENKLNFDTDFLDDRENKDINKDRNDKVQSSKKRTKESGRGNSQKEDEKETIWLVFVGFLVSLLIFLFLWALIDKPKSNANFESNTDTVSDKQYNEKTGDIEEKENKCKDGYAPSLDNTNCVKIPENAHAVNSPTDVWLCDDGYKEVGNKCVKKNNENYRRLGEYSCLTSHYYEALELRPEEDQQKELDNLETDLKSQMTRINNLTREINNSNVTEHSSEYRINNYNRKIRKVKRLNKKYDREYAVYKSKLEKYNRQVSKYNNYLEQNCNKVN